MSDASETETARGGLIAHIVDAAVRNWRLVVAVTFLVAVMAVGLSYLVSPVYQAEVALIPASAVSGESGVQGTAGLLSLARGVGIDFAGGVGDPSGLVPEILNSADFLDRLLGRTFSNDFGDSATLAVWLREQSGIELDRSDRLYRFARNEVFRSSYDAKSGVTTISVVMSGPVLAARVANACVQEIDGFNLELRSSQASQEEEFISQRIAEVDSQLAASESNLTEFRLNNRRISEAPALMAQEARLLTDFQLNKELYLTLKQQKELSSIRKMRSVPSFRVLDSARPDPERVRPRRGIFATGGLFLGLAISLFILFLRSPGPHRPIQADK